MASALQLLVNVWILSLPGVSFTAGRCCEYGVCFAWRGGAGKVEDVFRTLWLRLCKPKSPSPRTLKH